MRKSPRERKNSAEQILETVHAGVRQQHGWPALFLVVMVVLSAAIAYSVGEQRAAAVAVFATAAITASILAARHHRVSASFCAIFIAVIVALWNPRLLAFFGPEVSQWSNGGAWAGLLLLLLAAPFLALRSPRKAAGIRPPEAAAPHRSMAYDLLLTTVSRIPTLVKRMSPLPSPRRQEKITPPASDPAAYVLRGLPTPPEPVRRWPTRRPLKTK